MKRYLLRLIVIFIVGLCFLGFADAPVPHPFKNPWRHVNLSSWMRSTTGFYPVDLKEGLTGFTRRMPLDNPIDNRRLGALPENREPGIVPLNHKISPGLAYTSSGFRLLRAEKWA